MDANFTVSALGSFTLVEFLTSALMNPTELERIWQALAKVADAHAGEKVLLDFTRVEFLSSQAIGLVIAMHRRVTSQPGGMIILCGVGTQLLQLLSMTRLDRILPVVKNQQAALDLEV